VTTGGGVTVTTIGQHYDEPGTGGAWTVFKKFDGASGSGPNHDNGNAWTWYYSTTPISTGSNTVIHIGFKVGSLYNQTTYQRPAPGLDVGYDGLSVSTSMMSSPPATFNPPPTGGSGGGGGGGGAPPGGGVSGGGSRHNSENLAHRCGCSTIAADLRGAALLGLAAVALGLALLLRRRS